VGAPETQFTEHRRFLNSLSDEELARYAAARQEAERIARMRARRREHLYHRLGLLMLWLASLVLAFALGHGVASLTFMRLSVLAVGGLTLGGAVLLVLNRPGRED
jgi:hypothetical protein